MKRIILSLAVLLTFSNSLLFAIDPSNISFSKLETDERAVKNFSSVAAGGPIQVIIILGDREGLRFEGDADAISTLISEVKGNVLIIRPQTSWTSWAHKYENKKIIAYVSAKTVKSLTMSGNGSMIVKGKIEEASLTATLSGSGSISASADVNNFTGVISGSGNLNISGSATDATVTISGSGSLTKGLSVDDLTAVISGSGSITINASDNINAVISGSGSVNYSGNADVEKKIVGAGRVRKI